MPPRLSPRRLRGSVTPVLVWKCPRTSSSLCQRCYSDGRLATPESTSQSTTVGIGARKPVSRDIAVLGGGITGLTAAYFLARLSPSWTVTIYESSDRLGGWVNSDSVDIGTGRAVFEHGPRSLRPGTMSGAVTLDIVKRLGLEDDLLLTPKNAAAARNRYIYYPDHLVRMPHPSHGLFPIISNLFSEPAFTGFLPALLLEYFRPRRPQDLSDESIGSFISRRFRPELADNLVSAVLHGIYAGDVYQLSARSLLSRLWHMEGAHNSITRAFAQGYNRPTPILRKDVKILQGLEQSDGMKNAMKEVSVYSFKGGLGTLAGALEKNLRKMGNVRIKMGTSLTSIRPDEASGGIKLTEGQEEAVTIHSHAVSTLGAGLLSDLSSKDLSCLKKIPSVTVTVVNLFFRTPGLLPVSGFGYLIPRTVPLDQNPERALGVVFDSDAVPDQDTAPGTKVTVMLGGHWWNGWQDSDLPDPEQAKHMARAVLARHLGIHEEPVYALAQRCVDCIPQYVVGHQATLKQAHWGLLKGFSGRLSVAGSSYNGVGLNDCVRGAWELVETGFKDGEAQGLTGLEEFLKDPDWVRVKEVKV